MNQQLSEVRRRHRDVADRRRLRDLARCQARGRRRRRRDQRRHACRARRVRPLRPLRRDGGGRARRRLLASATFRIARNYRQLLPAGAARNALDCALLGLRGEALQATTRCRARGLVGSEPDGHRLHDQPRRRRTTMASKAAAAADIMPLLKIKLGGEGDADRMRQIRRACPDARLIADANEAWTPALLPELMASGSRERLRTDRAAVAGRGRRCALAQLARPVPVCADESLHTRADLRDLAGRYDAVNIKLDKAGGLTEALDLMARSARDGVQDHGRAAWWRLRSRWHRQCCLPRRLTGSTSMAPYSWRAIANPVSATRARSSIRPSLSFGAERRARCHVPSAHGRGEADGGNDRHRPIGATTPRRIQRSRDAASRRPALSPPVTEA